MARMVLPKEDLKQIILERRRTGAARLDEVWNGVYVMSPEADNQHQQLALDLVAGFLVLLGRGAGFRFYPTINISDRETGWRKNFRIPDASVFLPGNPARDLGTHWLGGPDFAVEVLSKGDRARQKFAFYASVGVRELLLVNRRPWRLELHRREGSGWFEVGASDIEVPDALASHVLPLSFRLVPGPERPQVEVTRASDGQTWLA
jgi:Uma2 family endonuclease